MTQAQRKPSNTTRMQPSARRISESKTATRPRPKPASSTIGKDGQEWDAVKSSLNGADASLDQLTLALDALLTGTCTVSNTHIVYF